jgi:signal peptidase II
VRDVCMPDKRLDFRALPWALWAVSLVVVALDQITKIWAQASFVFAEASPVTPYFYFTLRYNEGAAFSFLAGAGGWQRWVFTALASVVSLVLAFWIARIHRNPGKRLESVGLALILGGALGNLYDRLTLGHVVDFIVFHYQQYEWPAFNIADAGICVGAALLILDMFKSQKARDE